MMKIQLTDGALAWFKDEFEAEVQDEIRLFVRYGGEGGFQQGFSLGITKEAADHPAVQEVVDGVTFYIEEKDIWYFDGENVTISYNDVRDEIEYIHGNKINSI